MRNLAGRPGKGQRWEEPRATSRYGAVVMAIAGTALGVLPVYLLGGLAVQIRGELGFSESLLGLAVSAFFATSAIASVPAGRFVERIGARWGLAVGGLFSALSLLIVGLAASWPVLALGIAVGGLSNAIAQLAANLAIAEDVRVGRQGFAFGLKQAAVPAASVVAGFSVPLVALTIGWRWAFLGALAAPLMLALLASRSDARPRRRRHGSVRRSLRPGDAPLIPLLVLSVAGAFGTFAANSLAAFLVESSVTRGLTVGGAGVLLAVGSAVGVGIRVYAGLAADRRTRGHLRAVAGHMVVGVTGLALLAAGRGAGVIILATVLAFGGVWGWNGIFTLAIVDHNRAAPAAATGITQAGVYLGGVVGPSVFGRLVEGSGYAAAWTTTATMAFLGAGGILFARHLLRRSGTLLTPLGDAGRS